MTDYLRRLREAVWARADGEDSWPWGVPPERFGELEERRDDEPRRDGAEGPSA